MFCVLLLCTHPIISYKTVHSLGKDTMYYSCLYLHNLIQYLAQSYVLAKCRIQLNRPYFSLM